MNVHFSVESIAPFHEVDLTLVDFKELRECPVCGSSPPLEVATLKDSLGTAWCRACTHLYRYRRPTPDWYRGWYESSFDVSFHAQRSARAGQAIRRAASSRLSRSVKDVGRRVAGVKPERRYEEVVDFCRQVVDPGARVLDVGCGHGSLLYRFLKRGCEGAGIDPSPHRVAAATRAGLNVRNLSVEDLSPVTFGTPFDLVVANHVLDYVLDPRSFMKRVAEVLKPGGWIFVAVPNQSNDFLLERIFFGLQLHSFSRRSLIETLDSCGFNVQRTMDDRQLRVLAQYRPDDERSKGDPPPADFLDDRAEDWLLGQVLGPEYAGYGDAEMYCKWSEIPESQAIRTLYDVRYEKERYPFSGRMMRFGLEGPPAVPLVFVRQRENSSAPFWVR